MSKYRIENAARLSAWLALRPQHANAMPWCDTLGLQKCARAVHRAVCPL